MKKIAAIIAGIIILLICLFGCPLDGGLKELEWAGYTWEYEDNIGINDQGNFLILGLGESGRRIARINNQRFSDISIEVEMQKTIGVMDNSYGVILRSNADATTFYLFVITIEGYYAIFKSINKNLKDLIYWTSSEQLNTGYNTWNKVRIEMNNGESDNIKFYINDSPEPVFEDNDTGIRDGFVSLIMIENYKDNVPGGNNRVEFRNFVINEY